MENDGQGKQGQKQLPFDQLEQVDADHAFALALQQQESAFTMLETIGSDVEDDGDGDEDEEEEEEELGSSSSNDMDSNLESQDLYELELLENEESSDTDEIEEDEVDPDDMSYEELMALGEVVGEENRGMSMDEIASSLTPYVHKFVECKATIDRCVICQVDYENGDHLVALNCQHPFHFECINQWLQIKKVCPICSIEVTPLNHPENL